jgi:hypothetical protein
MVQKRYAYLMGANGPQTDRLSPLKYAEKDARRLADALKALPCDFTRAEWITAIRRDATLAGLNHFTGQCESSSLLFIHFSGHAFYDEQLYLLCNDTDIKDLVSSAIEISAIKTILRRCRARYKVLALDCCHAGGAYAGTFKGDQEVNEALKQTFQGSASVILSACSRHERTRELETLDGGAGFLSWVLISACTNRFQEASSNGYSLSLADIWRWMPSTLLILI